MWVPRMQVDEGVQCCPRHATDHWFASGLLEEDAFLTKITAAELGMWSTVEGLCNVSTLSFGALSGSPTVLRSCPRYHAY